MTVNQLPLESLLIKLWKKSPQDFPKNGKYDSRYQSILSDLETAVYPHINAMLAASNGGLYTDHGPDHFREVIRYAGKLLDIEGSKKLPAGLTGYDIYILLVAILLHDAGNIGGRDKHERRTNEIINKFTTLAQDKNEKRLIADIARAHGGKTDAGDKDTISTRLKELDTIQSARCHPQFIAALARFADEICESKNRAAAYPLATDTLPPQSRAYHLYADCIRYVDFDAPAGTVRIGYSIDIKDLAKPLQGDSGETYISDEILDRLDKMELERRYCSQFTRGYIKLDRIAVLIEILSEHEVVRSFNFEMPERGYPLAHSSLRKSRPDLLHEALIKALGEPAQ